MTEKYGKHLAFPFHVGSDGRSAQVSTLNRHVHDEMIQLVLTDPGERLFLPEFGSGIKRLVFENLDPASQGMAKATVTQAVTRWLGHRVNIEDIGVDIENETIEVTIKFSIAGTGELKILKFRRNGA